MGVKQLNGRKYKLVAPDGGWAYMIGVSVIINMITTSTFVTSFGMIYKDIFIELKIDSTGVTFLNGVSAFWFALSGLAATPLLRFFSIRQLGLITAIIFNLGIFCNVFVNSKITFFICMGILQSFGHGIIYNLSCTALNNYFVKKRLLAVSFTQTLVGIVGLITPQFIKWSLETFGLRGTLLLISGISLQNVVGMVLMQPVEWHMKKLEVPEDKEHENKSLLPSNGKPSGSKEGVIKSKSCESVKRLHNEKINIEHQGQSHLKKMLSNVIDVPLFKSFILSNASVGTALAVFSECTFISMLPQALYALGWSEGDVAWALSLNAMGDLATRVLLIFTSNWLLNIGSHEIYVIGLVLALISRIGMLWSDDRIVMTIFITMMGISRCTIMILIQMVVADSVKQEKFSSAMGILLLLYGFFNIVVGPIIGFIRDLTNSYSTAFYILTSCYGIVIMFWTIEIIYKRNKHKRLPKGDTIKV